MKNPTGNIMHYVCILLFFISSYLYSYSPFTNYKPAIQVNDIVIKEPYVWGTGLGGLLRIKPSTREVKLFSNTDDFPDLNLTALCLDSKGNIWIGTKRGYLYRRNKKGYQRIYTSYVVTGDTTNVWKINDMYSYKKYLIIGSTQGCSVFDTDEYVVLQNATLFGTFNSPVVNSVTVHKDTLYLGCLEGVAKLDIAGNKIETSNFIDNTIWNTVSMTTEKGIKSFPVINDSIVYMDNIATVYNDTLLYAYDILHNNGLSEHYIKVNDTTEWEKTNSAVLSFATADNGDLWFGTGEDFLFRWDGYTLQQYTVNSLTFGSIYRVFVSEENDIVWCLPFIRKQDIPWWQGVGAFNGEYWKVYRPGNPHDFGSLGDGIDFLGIAEGPFGNMWFGNNGKCIKKYNPSRNRWDGFYIGDSGKSTFEYKKKNQGMGWGKCDAIARDSSDYMWFAAYISDSGCVICFDPSAKLPTDKEYDNNTTGIKYPHDSTYRYFFPKESVDHFEEPKQLNVDAANNIFLGGQDADNGRLLVFNYSGNPLVNGVSSPILDKNLSKIWHMHSTPDSSTWIVTGQGLYHFQYHETAGASLTVVKTAPNNLTCVEYENNYRSQRTDNRRNTYETVETVLWGGTQNDGLLKIYAHKILNDNGTIDSIGIDSTREFRDADGLVCNRVNYMDMDRKNGYLWVATEEGLSRYNIGHAFVTLQNNEKLYAYPNPFIKSRHKQVVFDNCAPGSQISVYTVDGSLVAHIVDEGNNAVKTANEWTYIWHPDAKLIPGVYFYTAKIQQVRSKGTVGKLLIIP